MNHQSKKNVWVRFIGMNVGMLACFLLIFFFSSVCRPVTRIVACVLYLILWGMNAGMRFYQDMKAPDPIAFSHSNVARIINNMTLIGVMLLCVIFFCVS